MVSPLQPGPGRVAVSSSKSGADFVLTSSQPSRDPCHSSCRALPANPGFAAYQHVSLFTCPCNSI